MHANPTGRPPMCSAKEAARWRRAGCVLWMLEHTSVPIRVTLHHLDGAELTHARMHRQMIACCSSQIGSGLCFQTCPWQATATPTATAGRRRPA